MSKIITSINWRNILFAVVPIVLLAAVVMAEMIDDAAFAPGISRVQPVGGEVDDTAPDSVDEGDVGAVRMSSNRAMHVIIKDAAKNERGANVDASNQLGVADAAAAVLLGTIDADTGSIMTAVEIMDDWDEVHDAAVGTDGVLVMGEAHSAQPAAVADADAARLALNIYGQVIMAGYTWATDSVRMFVTNPPSSQHTEVSLCALTGIAASTTAYCGYWDMDGYRTWSVHCIATATPTDTTTYTVECTGEDNGTAPASCTYIDVTPSLTELNGFDKAASYVDEAALLVPTLEMPVKYCRVKYVTNAGGGNDGAIECFVKKLY